LATHVGEGFVGCGIAGFIFEAGRQGEWRGDFSFDSIIQ
jgi:hypothetical protein